MTDAADEWTEDDFEHGPMESESDLRGRISGLEEQLAVARGRAVSLVMIERERRMQLATAVVAYLTSRAATAYDAYSELKNAYQEAVKP